MDSGYTNEETRQLAIYLANIEPDYLHWCEVVASEGVDDAADRMEADFIDLQQTIVDNPEQTEEAARQLLADVGSLWRVNWREVAEEFVA
jgi:hypothetical protein